MVTLFSASLPFELDNRTSRFYEPLHRLLQSFWCASRVSPSNTLNRVAQQIGDVVLVYLSPTQLGRERASQVMPSQSTFHVLAKWNTGSVTGFRKSPSESARAYCRMGIVKYSPALPVTNDFRQRGSHLTVHRHHSVTRTFPLSVHEQKPVGPYFHVSPVCGTKDGQSAEIHVLYS